MTVQKETKINKLLQQWPAGTVAPSRWLRQMGVSASLQAAYARSGWVRPLGAGAVVRQGDRVTWQGALFALQRRLQLPVHVGGRSALELQGQGHYVPLRPRVVELWVRRGTRLPRWFVREWGREVRVTTSGIFREATGFVEHDVGGFSIRVASVERAMLECLAGAPRQCGLDEASQMMRGLVTLRPRLVQSLLQSCRCIKTKRLFLALAHETRHPWLSFVDIGRVTLGRGPRQVVPGGRLNKRFGITMPRSMKI